MRRFVTPLLVTAAILVPVAALVSADGGAGGIRPAPPLPDRVLSGPPATIQGLRGRPVIVHFWASWCTPCEREGPELRRLARGLGGRATLVGIDWSDRRDRALAFVRRHGWRFSNLEDPRSEAGQRYRVAGLPTTFILDARGGIVRQLPGPQTASGLLAELSAVSSPPRD